MESHHGAALNTPSSPAIQRGAMTPEPWTGLLGGLRMGLKAWLAKPTAPRATRQRRNLSGLPAVEVPWSRTFSWEAVARERRWLLVAILAYCTCMMGWMMSSMQDASAPWAWRAIHLTLFVVLFAWVCSGCLTAVFGFGVLMRGDRFALSARAVRHLTLSKEARTAVIMPIRNEEVAAVFGGMQAICASLQGKEAVDLFDLYILSDTDDADLRTAEVVAWHALRASIAAHDPGLASRIHYRWRQRRTGRKAGNVADFCRRFGSAYRYMVVLDADSIMSGESLVSLVRLMEAHPQAGIIQSMTKPCGQKTLHARAQQFAAQVTGRLFALGMHYWQLGESHYWGHNAIIRVKPFMRYCALAPLPGDHGLSGDILSHDFVEAALMGRAGLEVWMVFDLPDSYEQPPPDFIEELRRDRRWCQGNLKNARLLAEPGLRPVHRVSLLTAVMAYASAPMWLAFVVSGVALSGSSAGGEAGAVDGLSVVLWTVMFILLFLPRVLGVLAIVLRGEQAAFGGGKALLRSVLLEAGLSTVQAPMRMVAHSAFILAALGGVSLQWRSPPRHADAVGWRDAITQLGPMAAFPLLLGGAMLILWPAAWWFLALICLPCMLAVALTVWTSQHQQDAQGVKGWLAQHHLVTPEESHKPSILAHAHHLAQREWPMPKWDDLLHDGQLFDLIKAGGAHGPVRRGSCGETRERWMATAWQFGIDHLNNRQRLQLLNEPGQLRVLLDGLSPTLKESSS